MESIHYQLTVTCHHRVVTHCMVAAFAVPGQLSTVCPVVLLWALSAHWAASVVVVPMSPGLVTVMLWLIACHICSIREMGPEWGLDDGWPCITCSLALPGGLIAPRRELFDSPPEPGWLVHSDVPVAG